MQHEPPAGTPWWAWLIVVVLVLFILPMYRIWTNQRKQGAEQRATAVRIARVDHQVTNEHRTNLRDDMDVATEAAQKAAQAAQAAARAATEAAEVAKAALASSQRLEREHEETRRDIGGIREEQRDSRKEVRAVAAGLDDSVKERRTQIRDLHHRLDDHLEGRTT